MPQIKAITMTLLLRVLEKQIDKVLPEINSNHEFNNIFSDLDLMTIYDTFKDKIIQSLSAQILQHAECEEHAASLLFGLLNLGVEKVRLSAVALRKNSAVRHGFCSFRYKNEIYIADSYCRYIFIGK